MNYYDLIIMVLIAGIVITGITIETVKEESDILARLNKLRGLFAVVIVIGHSVQGHMESTYLYAFEKLLCICVAYFFFVSAYGITLSAAKREDYFNGFMVRKCGYILFLSIIAYLVEIISNYVVYHNKGFEENIVVAFFKYTNWYVWEVIGFYILLRIVFGVIKSHRGVVLLMVAVVTGVIMYTFRVYEPYYTAIFAFPMGVLVAEHREGFYKLLNDKKLVYILVLAVFSACGLGCFVLPEGIIIRDLFMRNSMGIGAVLALILVVSRINVGNAFLKFLTKYSAEIYIFQFVWIRQAAKMGYSYKIVLVYILIMTLLCAVIFHYIDEKVKSMLKAFSL